MHRSKQINPSNPSHVEITFTTSSFTIKGDPSVVQPLAMAVTRAPSFMSQAAQTATPPPALTAPTVTQTDDASAPAEAAQADLDFTPTPPPPSVVTTPAKPPRKRAYAVPGVVDSLRAEDPTDGVKVFVGSRALESDIDKGIFAASWMRHVRTVNEFDINHVNTCFEMLSWKLPEDPGSLLRSMKKGKYVRAIQGKPGLYELTAKGNNRYLELK